jgi:dTDP-glucose 4,6-dehydratase/UDP-glucose 4-epimerase
MKILIIGSEGFIGSHLANFYLSKGLEVIGTDLNSVSRLPIVYYQSNQDDDSLNKVFKEHTLNYCINAAGNGDVNFSVSNPEQDFKANTYFTFQILEGLRLYNPTCKFLYISSAAVYGNPAKLPVVETDPVNPISPYGWHKLMSEKICKEYYGLYNIESAVIRPFSVYGPGLKKQILWDVFNKTSQPIEYLELWGGGQEARDFIYIDDLIAAIDIILIQENLQADIYNIASGEMTLIKDIVNLLLHNLEIQKSVVFNGKVHKGNPIQWQADISQLSDLGFVPKVKIEQGISLLTTWLKTQ